MYVWTRQLFIAGHWNLYGRKQLSCMRTIYYGEPTRVLVFRQVSLTSGHCTTPRPWHSLRLKGGEAIATAGLRNYDSGILCNWLIVFEARGTSVVTWSRDCCTSCWTGAQLSGSDGSFVCSAFLVGPGTGPAEEKLMGVTTAFWFASRTKLRGCCYPTGHGLCSFK